MRYFLAGCIPAPLLGLLVGFVYGLQFGFWPGVGMFLAVSAFWLVAMVIVGATVAALVWADKG